MCTHYVNIGHFVSDNSPAIHARISKVLPETERHLCFPHIMRSVDEKSSWRDMIGGDKEHISRVKRDIFLLGSCTTYTMFYYMFSLVMARWRSLGLQTFADFFQGNYGPISKSEGNWYLGSTGSVGLAANNNALESYYSKIKGTKKSGVPPVMKNKSGINVLVNSEIPKLLAHDAIHYT